LVMWISLLAVTILSLAGWSGYVSVVGPPTLTRTEAASSDRRSNGTSSSSASDGSGDRGATPGTQNSTVVPSPGRLLSWHQAPAISTQPS
jgi:hypothetical protein